MKAVAETIGVARSHLHDKVHRARKSRGPYRKPEDDALVQLVRSLVDADLWLSPHHGPGEQGTCQGRQPVRQPQTEDFCLIFAPSKGYDEPEILLSQLS